MATNLSLQQRWLLRFCLQRYVARELNAAAAWPIDAQSLLRSFLSATPGSAIALLVTTATAFPTLGERFQDAAVATAFQCALDEGLSSLVATPAMIRSKLILELTQLLYTLCTGAARHGMAEALRGAAAPSTEGLLDLLANAHSTSELPAELRGRLDARQAHMCAGFAKAASQ
eukprot:3542972-Prymnesium_polylepis.1